MRFAKIILGNIIITAAYAFLTVPNKIVNGGVTSFAMILASLCHGSTALIADGVTVLLLLICYVFLGKEYVKGSIVSGICYMLFFTLFDSLNVRLISLRLPAAFAAALFVGTGYYLCISQKATAISFDTVALILHQKYPRINIAAAMFVINVCVLLLGMFEYGIDAVLLGVAFSAVQSAVLNGWLKFDDISASKKQGSLF